MKSGGVTPPVSGNAEFPFQFRQARFQGAHACFQVGILRRRPCHLRRDDFGLVSHTRLGIAQLMDITRAFLTAAARLHANQRLGTIGKIFQLRLHAGKAE